MANVFRADHVGALIKPEAVVSAHVARDAGGVDAAAVKAAEDAAILTALEMQKAVVMTVVTDGELRRAHPEAPYVAAIDGITRRTGPAAATALQSDYAVSAPLKVKSRLTEHEVSFLKASTRARFKIALTMPSSLALRLHQPIVTERAYPRIHDLAGAFGELLRDEIEALFAEGVPYVQLGAPAYDMLFEGADRRLDAIFDELLAIDVAALERVRRPKDTTLAVHIGRTRDQADSSDRYERMVQRLLERLPIDRVLLEYHEPREHDFSALAALPKGRMAVLGLVRTEGEPDELGAVLDRIDQAASVTNQDNLALSPRRAFRNVAGQSADAQLKAQRAVLTRASEAVQQFWGLEL